MHWRRKWQPTPVFLLGESQGWGAWWAAVYGVAQIGHDWSDLAAAGLSASMHGSLDSLRVLEHARLSLAWAENSFQYFENLNQMSCSPLWSSHWRVNHVGKPNTCLSVFFGGRHTFWNTLVWRGKNAGWNRVEILTCLFSLQTALQVLLSLCLENTIVSFDWDTAAKCYPRSIVQ